MVPEDDPTRLLVTVVGDLVQSEPPQWLRVAAQWLRVAAQWLRVVGHRVVRLWLDVKVIRQLTL